MPADRPGIPEQELTPESEAAFTSDDSSGPETSFGGDPAAFSPDYEAHDGTDMNDQMTAAEREAFEQQKYEQG